MELSFIITILCIIVSLMLKPSHSLKLIQPQSSHDQLGHNQQHSLPTLHRKLMFTKETSVNGNEGQDMVSYNTRKDNALSGGKGSHNDKEAKMRPGGTWREWVEAGGDTSQFFTMDYSHVRRRRPIHNKSLPLAP